MSELTVVLSCEHATNWVPESLVGMFAGQQALLESHRGFDAGAIELAERLARRLGAPLERSQVTRLIVDLNRSEHHPSLFSRFTGSLHPETRQALLDRFYRPFREHTFRRVEAAIEKSGRVIHLSVHTFTPELDGKVRRADIGLLYDPSRKRELELARLWKKCLKRVGAGLVIRSNYPYRGTADGHVTALRSRFDESRYLGLELEVNQKHCLGPREEWLRLQEEIVRTFAEVIGKQRTG